MFTSVKPSIHHARLTLLCQIFTYLRCVNMANIINWLFSDSSSDEEEIRRPKKLYRARRNSDDSNFRSLYRFDRENFNFLVRIFFPDDVHDRRGGGLSNAQKMKIFLRYVGDPGFQARNFCIFKEICVFEELK